MKRPPKWYHFNRWVFLSAGIGLGIAVGAFFLLRNFLFPADSDPGDILTATATALGGLTIGGVAVMQFRKHKWAEYQAAHSTKLEEDTKTGERLSKAIEHLGDKNEDIRVAAVYELKRLAVDSTRDREAIGQILLKFIHRKTRDKIFDYKENPLEQDVKAAIEMLSNWVQYGGLNAENMDLCGIWLVGAQLSRANFTRAILEDAHLEGAYFFDACFLSAYLKNAHFKKATLLRTRLSQSVLEGADLREIVAGVSSIRRRMFGLVIDVKKTRFDYAWIDDKTCFDENVKVKTFSDDSNRVRAVVFPGGLNYIEEKELTP